MRKSFIIAVTLFFAAGCGLLSTKEKGKIIEHNASDLAGAWQSNCVASDALGLTHSQRDFNFNIIGDFDKTERFYDNEDCSNSQFTYQVAGTYAALGHHPKNDKIKQINFTIDSAVVTINAENAVDVLNSASLCGKSDWKLDTETDITDKDCGGFTVKKGDVIFDVYALQKAKLYFGQKFFFMSSDDADSRPDDISKDVVFEPKK